MPASSPTPRSSYRGLIYFLAFLIAALVIYRLNTPPPGVSKLPVYTIVPPFSFTERSGKTISNQDLAGKIWVADFIYTTCPGPCPLVSANMARLQKSVASDPNVQLVTFTVDPNHDTPPVLAAYADKFGADANRWWFLTGAEKPMDTLIQNGFWQAVQDNQGSAADGGFTVTHSTKLVLVDADGNVRGFYDGVGTDGRANLLQSIKTLEKEENL